MEIIPAIDLLEGTCVRLFQGDYDQVTQFNPDPVRQALNWQDDGAKLIHIVDLDGAKQGVGKNDEVLLKIIEKISIPLQLGGGIRNIERAEYLLNKGVDRIILGTLALEQPNLVIKLAGKYPNQIIVGIDAKEGYVATRGWINKSDTKATDLVSSLNGVDLAAIIYTDISKDGTLSGPNINQLREVAEVSTVSVIASGGIGTYEDIISLQCLEKYGVDSVIVGRALYENNIDLSEAIKVANNLNLIDVINNE